MNNIPYSTFKKYEEPLSRLSLVFNRLASLLLFRIQNISITANQITIASLICGALAPMVLFYTEMPVYVVMLLILSYFLDVCDGIWARAKNQTSVFGGWLDHFGDVVKDFWIDAGLILYYLTFVLEEVHFLSLAILLSYLVIKSIFYIVKLDFEHDLRQAHQKELRLITISPAEKYVVFWPVLVLIPQFIIVFFVIFSFLYLGMGYRMTRRFLLQKQATL